MTLFIHFDRFLLIRMRNCIAESEFQLPILVDLPISTCGNHGVLAIIALGNLLRSTAVNR